MNTIQPLVSPFTIEGKLEDLVTKSHDCIKYLQLVTEHGQYQIKVAKEVRKTLSTKKLQTGCLVKVTGMRKHNIKKGEVKHKAYEIELLEKPIIEKAVAHSSKSAVATKPKAKVLFCQKSTCWKKGGKAAWETLKAQLQSRGIADQVEVKTVGCLKQCKKAPNIVIMPDKARYSKVKPKQISSLIEEHL